MRDQWHSTECVTCCIIQSITDAGRLTDISGSCCLLCHWNSSWREVARQRTRKCSSVLRVLSPVNKQHETANDTFSLSQCFKCVAAMSASVVNHTVVHQQFCACMIASLYVQQLFAPAWLTHRQTAFDRLQSLLSQLRWKQKRRKQNDRALHK